MSSWWKNPGARGETLDPGKRALRGGRRLHDEKESENILPSRE